MKSLYVLLFCLPLKHLTLTSGYGYRIHPITKHYTFHSGIDLRAHSDTVYSISSGIAKYGYDQLLGYFIKVSDADLTITYGHLSQILNSNYITEGAPIGITGATGRVTGEHLHLSIKYHGYPIDPLQFLYTLIKSKDNEH
ncbi:MAG: M23 family metallopeptidase [Sphingobacteriales bacterium]